MRFSSFVGVVLGCVVWFTVTVSALCAVGIVIVLVWSPRDTTTGVTLTGLALAGCLMAWISFVRLLDHRALRCLDGIRIPTVARERDVSVELRAVGVGGRVIVWEALLERPMALAVGTRLHVVVPITTSLTADAVADAIRRDLDSGEPWVRPVKWLAVRALRTPVDLLVVAADLVSRSGASTASTASRRRAVDPVRVADRFETSVAAVGSLLLGLLLGLLLDAGAAGAAEGPVEPHAGTVFLAVAAVTAALVSWALPGRWQPIVTDRGLHERPLDDQERSRNRGHLRSRSVLVNSVPLLVAGLVLVPLLWWLWVTVSTVSRT
ncbi:MAG: hypothetical protein L0H96_04150 [Humibacillus sp.]|nr:hypothetical protein [Humibacillus sp.]MDN5776081.1 hypothetical protein [Humibacillus sp.]